MNIIVKLDNQARALVLPVGYQRSIIGKAQNVRVGQKRCGCVSTYNCIKLFRFVHVDNFENVVVNIRREVFEKTLNGRDFSLFFKRNDPITKLSGNYCDVPVGEQLCLFNAAGFLEIAVNMGKAATLLGLKVEDVVEVSFE